MHINRILTKFIIFTVIFTLLFYSERYFIFFKYIPESSIPWLFSAIVLMFSIISGFVIQSKWQTWNELIDATHGEISSLKQLHMLSKHFPKTIQSNIRIDIIKYLDLVIKESNSLSRTFTRSGQIENAIYKLEETVLDIDYSQHPGIGNLAYHLVRKTLNYREKRLQNIDHNLPLGVRTFTLCSLFTVIFASLFIGNSINFSEYILTLTVSLLAFGIYLLIDDLDHPYRPGQWHLKNDEYVTLFNEINKSNKRIRPTRI